MQAVILAGGKGTRLKPYTNNIPKPLVKLDDMPILEIVLRQLKKFGVKEVFLAVNHLSDLIESFFKDGDHLGLKIFYSKERDPLGTAGPLNLIENLDNNFIMMNGDILTNLNFKDMFMKHDYNKSLASIAVYNRELRIDLGILELDNKNNFSNYIEKPVFNYNVSTGIYIFNKMVKDYIPKNIKFDMPELIQSIHKNKKNIFCYKSNFDWLDIGRVDDYEKANILFKENKSKYLNL